MKVELKANHVGQMVMPAHIRKVSRNECELLPNTKAGVIYPIGTDPRQVLRSIEVVVHDLRNQLNEIT